MLDFLHAPLETDTCHDRHFILLSEHRTHKADLSASNELLVNGHREEAVVTTNTPPIENKLNFSFPSSKMLCRRICNVSEARILHFSNTLDLCVM